jgi:hypothetical protein
MKMSYTVLGLLLALTAPAVAGDTFNSPPTGKICIDTHKDYQALYLKGSRTDVVAHQTLGRDHRVLKISTTCFDLRDALTIRLSTGFNCVAMGDDVFTDTIDGHAQSCRVTHVEPYVPAAG